MPTTSWSEVKLFRKCPKAHDYKYRQHLKRKRKALGLLRGSILHEMLDAYYSHKMGPNHIGPDPWGVLEDYEKKYKVLFAEEQEIYGDLINDCTAIFEGYIRRWRKEKLHFEGSEEFVATDIAGDLRFLGRIDKRVMDENGRRFLMDHKFMRTIPTAEDRFADLQLLMYVWAWNRWNPDKEVDGVIWDYGRAKAPAVPELLKGGSLSKRKNIDTDTHTYLRAIKDHGLEYKDYVDILKQLEGKETTFFERVILPNPPQAMVKQVVEDFRTTAVMISKLTDIAPRYMSQFNCKTCEFKALCEAEVRGHDADFVKKSKYESRDPQKEGEDYGQEEG